MSQFLLLAAILVAVAAVRIVLNRRYRSLKHIRGPDPPSWVFGMLALFTFDIPLC